MNLNDLLDQTAARAPQRVALVTATSSWTFARLHQEVQRAAEAFAHCGIRKGDCVALVLRNGPEFVTAYFGLVRLGAVAVPINFLVQKAEELRYMLADCQAKGVVTQKEFLKGILAARTLLKAPLRIWATDTENAGQDVLQFDKFLAGEGSGPAARATAPGDAPSQAPHISPSSKDVAAILYTSGTTGFPKGVMLSHGNLVSNCESSIEALRLREQDVILTILPMFHTFAWTGCVLVALRLGAKNVVSNSIAPAGPWIKMMGRHGVTVFAAVPQVYAVLAKEARGIKRLLLKYWFFRRVRFGASGAAPLSPDTARAFEAAMGIPIVEGYGLTETSPVISINRPLQRKLGSVGLPIQDVQVKIIREDETTLPPGQEGEICARGPNVMLGYHGHPEATRDTFTRDGFLKTGDIGLLDEEGFLFVRDRKKDMIIVKGLKVFSAQVELVLNSHPQVEESAIVG
ncbi:MAG: AMP-binding protein, partial [Elusimicrobia bacterium]|nr:AMP-binding protein [Elusimicrobiota bacterium]